MKDEREYVIELGKALGHSPEHIIRAAERGGWDSVWGLLIGWATADHKRAAGY